MDRRGFMRGMLAATGVWMLPGTARAAGMCQMIDGQGTEYCEVGIQSNLASIAARSQEHTQWCWAACIEMLFRYYGRPVSQARIVAETFGSIVNMPAQPLQILMALNRTWVDDHNRPFHVRADSMTANLPTAHDDLYANNPLIVGTMGHAMVLSALGYTRSPLYGVQLQKMVVRDPWQNRGRRELTAPEAFNISFLARVRVG